MSDVLTLRAIVSRAGAGVAVLVGDERLDGHVDWIRHADVARLEPAESQGALILTSCLQFGADTRLARDFVSDAAAAGVAGILVSRPADSVRAEMAEAARVAGLPLLEVPTPAALAEVARATSLLARAVPESRDAGGLQAHKSLTAAAMKDDGHRTLIDRLAQLLGGTAAHYDPGGEFVHGAPLGTPRYSVEAASQISRLRSGKLPAAIGFEADGRHFILQSIGTGQALLGFLLCGVPRRFSAPDKTTVGVAASLLTVGLRRGPSGADPRRPVMRAIWKLVLAGHVSDAAEVAEAIGHRLPHAPFAVALVRGPLPAREAIGDAVHRIVATAIVSQDPDVLVALVPASHADAVADAVAEVQGATAGFSEPCALAGLDDALAQARAAADHAVRRGGAVQRFGALGADSFADLVDPKHAATWARSRLRPLLEHDESGRGDLMRSLRAWLEHNGQWDPAANALPVHRHTLRQRMSRVESLLDVSLDSVSVRSDLWYALVALDDGGVRRRPQVTPPG